MPKITEAEVEKYILSTLSNLGYHIFVWSPDISSDGL